MASSALSTTAWFVGGLALVSGLAQGDLQAPDGAIRIRLADEIEPPEDFRVHLRLGSLGTRVDKSAWLTGDGEVVFDALPEGRYRVDVTNRRPPNLAPQIVDLSSGETTDVALRGGSVTVHGQLLGVKRPTVGLLVWCRFAGRVRGDRSPYQAIGVVYDDGSYRIDGLGPGDYELRVGDNGERDSVGVFENIHHRLRLTDGSSRHDIEVPAGRIEARMAGVGRMSEGPLGSVRVFPRGWGPSSGNRGLFVEPDKDGKFSVRHLPPGDYNVWVDQADRGVIWRRATVTDAEPVQVVELTPPTGLLGGIKGVVANVVQSTGGGGRRSRREVTSVGVFPRDEKGYDFGLGLGYGIVDSEIGEFRIDNLVEGTYGVFVHSDQQLSTAVWQPDVVVSAGRVTQLALTVPAGREVQIQLDEGDESTRQSIWSLRMPSGDWLPFFMFVGSRPEGRRAGNRGFQLPLGQYTVSADFGDPVPVLHEFVVSSARGDTMKVKVVR